MSRPFRFAVQGGPLDDADALRRHARRVEGLGYEELFTMDHLGAVDPFLPLVVAAESTSMLRLGPLVVNNELHNPALLARTAATFDALSGGRSVLGMGTGYMRQEHDAASIELRPPGARVARLGESLHVLRELLDTGRSTFAGEHVTVAVDDLGVRPVQSSVPLLIGGHGRKVVALGAHFADIFQFTGLVHDPHSGLPNPGGFARDAVIERRDWLRAAAGERFDSIELSALVQMTHVGDGADGAAATSAERIGCAPELVDGTPFLLFGSVAEVIDKLHGLRDELGITHFVVRDPDGFAPVVEALAGT